MSVAKPDRFLWSARAASAARFGILEFLYSRILVFCLPPDQSYPKFYASVRRYTLEVETQRRAMGTSDRIPLIVVHELTHTQAKRSRRGKVPGMLADCIGEGAADFMTELVANSSINAYSKQWAEPRRDELFQRFARDMSEKAVRHKQMALHYRTAKDEPADHGYWIGNVICRGYYEQAKDKRETIRNIVTLADVESIVRNSRYAWLLDRP